MRLATKDAGLDIEVASAATSDWHEGKPIDPRSVAVALRNGVDLSNQRARQIQLEDFEHFTHIFALDQGNLKAIRKFAPLGCTAKIELLLDNVPGRRGQSVGDPYFSEDSAFDTTWADVSAAAHALVARFKP